MRTQHRLVTETFGIEALQLVLGWSMGAEQTYEWAVRYPDMVLRAIPFAGTAKTTPHDWLFVRMHENVIKADPAWRGGFYGDPAEVRAGLKAHAELWSVMGVTQHFYKNEDWKEVGFSSLDDFNRNFWEACSSPWTPTTSSPWHESGGTGTSASTPMAISPPRWAGSKPRRS